MSHHPTGFTHGLNEQGVFKHQWTSLFYASGNSEPASGNGGCPEVKRESGDPGRTWPCTDATSRSA